MSKRKTEKIATSASILGERLKELRKVMPEAFSEGKVDCDKLREALGDAVDDRPERYSFTWAGKRDGIRMLQQQSRATLRPAREESVNFDATQHVFIEGDNLEALKLMFKPYFGRVKMIYIDPPYNTGNDFIYPDNFADPLDTYLRLTGQKDAEGNVLTSNPETSGRFHSAWLSMIYPRLFLARQLLCEDGFIVISIDDAEVTNLRAVANELFGEENFVAVVVWDRNRKNDAKLFSVGHEYMVVYARNRQHLSENGIVLRAQKEGVEDVQREFTRLRSEHEDDWVLVRKGLKEFFNAMADNDPRKPLSRFTKVDAKGPYRDDGNPNWPGGGGPRYEVLHPNTRKACKIPRSGWRWPTKARFDEEYDAGHIVFGADEKSVPGVRSNLFEKTTQVMRSVNYSYAQTAAQEFDALFDGVRVFDNPKHYADLSQMVEYLTENGDLVVDFFAGSCSAAHAVLNSNRREKSSRRYLCVQLPEPVNEKTNTGQNALRLGMKTVAEIGKERIRRVIAKMRKESQGELAFGNREAPADIGMRVYKLAESNFRQWVGVENNDPEKYAETMAMFNDPLLPGWKPDDVLWEVALTEGYPLHSRIEKDESAKDLTVYRVTDPDRDQSFRITFDGEVTLAAVKPLGLKKGELFICRDVALDDETAANLALQCHLKTI